ncbi:DUF6308 family protein [Streptacidiphilus sp. MAP12-16]|uniref:DUF6308 family protein n=1 Tax=Streptacidiphilus sp. MAP12-16 TaxID=3156300 RepID=UPI0035185BC4
MLRVGGRLTPLGRAVHWVTQYFDATANQTGKNPYAYPAYDDLHTGSSPDQLTDGDLLAPTLLNAAPSITAFYTLQALRPTLEAALAAIPPDLTLQDAVRTGRHHELVGELFRCLDEQKTPGVQLTTLTKVLHRKRPLLIPLHDRHVRACYVNDGPTYPMRRTAGRTWAHYTATLAASIADDLDRQAEQWAVLRSCVPDIGLLRILDVVAWNTARQELA